MSCVSRSVYKRVVFLYKVTSPSFSCFLILTRLSSLHKKCKGKTFPFLVHRVNEPHLRVSISVSALCKGLPTQRQIKAAPGHIKSCTTHCYVRKRDTKSHWYRRCSTWHFIVIVYKVQCFSSWNIITKNLHFCTEIQSEMCGHILKSQIRWWLSTCVGLTLGKRRLELSSSALKYQAMQYS